MPAVVAAGVPIIVLLISHNLDQLAALYAIGVIGAVAINISLVRVPSAAAPASPQSPDDRCWASSCWLIWVTLAYVKREALLFVTRRDGGGTCRPGSSTSGSPTARARSPACSARRSCSSSASGALDRPRILVGTYGSDALARPALAEAKRLGRRWSSASSARCEFRRAGVRA